MVGDGVTVGDDGGRENLVMKTGSMGLFLSCCQSYTGNSYASRGRLSVQPCSTLGHITQDSFPISPEFGLARRVTQGIILSQDITIQVLQY